MNYRRIIAFAWLTVLTAWLVFYSCRGSAPQPLGMGVGGTYVGPPQRAGQYTVIEQPWFENVQIPAATPTVVKVFNPLATNSMFEAAETISLRYDQGDASLDASNGTAWINRKVAGALVGGAFCNNLSPVVCATSTATAIDYSTDPGGAGPSGILNGATAPLVWNGTAVEIVVTCPVACVAAGWPTALHEKDPGYSPPIDSGAPDAGPAAVTAISPNNGSAAGGTAVTITCNHGCSGCTGATLDTVACTSFSAVSDTSATCTSAAGSPGTGDVHMTGCTVSDLASGWTYNAAADGGSGSAPTLASICPLLFENTQTVTLHGTGFNTNGTLRVTFAGGLTTTATASSDTLATVVVPAVTPSGSAIALQVWNNSGTPSGTVSGYSPDTATNCPYLWVACSDTETLGDGGLVQGWIDNSRTYTAIQNTVVNQPLASTTGFDAGIVGLPSIHFGGPTGGTSTYLTNTTLPTLPAAMQIAAIVMTPASSVSGNTDIAAAVTPYYNMFWTNTPNIELYAGGGLAQGFVTAPSIFMGVAGDAGTIYQNNNLLVSGATAGYDTFAGGVNIGGPGGGSTYYDEYAVALCNAASTPTERGYWESVKVAIAGGP